MKVIQLLPSIYPLLSPLIFIPSIVLYTSVISLLFQPILHVSFLYNPVSCLSIEPSPSTSYTSPSLPPPPPFTNQLDRNKFTAEELYLEVLTILRQRHWDIFYSYPHYDHTSSVIDDTTETTTTTPKKKNTNQSPPESLSDQLLWRLEHIVRLSPYNITYWNDLGVLHMQRYEYTKAKECFILINKLQPDYTKAYINLQQIYQYQENLADYASISITHESIQEQPTNNWYITSLLGYNIYHYIENNKQIQFTNSSNYEQIPDIYKKIPLSTFMWSTHRKRKPIQLNHISTQLIPSLSIQEYKQYLKSLSNNHPLYKTTVDTSALKKVDLQLPLLITNLSSTRSWKKYDKYNPSISSSIPSRWWRLWSMNYFMKYYKDIRMLWDTDQLLVENNSDADFNYTNLYSSSVALLMEVSNTLKIYESSSPSSVSNNPNTRKVNNNPLFIEESYIHGPLSFTQWEQINNEIGKLPRYIGSDYTDKLLVYLYLGYYSLHYHGYSVSPLTNTMIFDIWDMYYNRNISYPHNLWDISSLQSKYNTQELDYQFKFFLNDFFMWSSYRSLVIIHNNKNHQEKRNTTESIWRSMVMNNLPYGQWFSLIKGKHIKWTICSKYSLNQWNNTIMYNNNNTLKNTSFIQGLWSLDEINTNNTVLLNNIYNNNNVSMKDHNFTNSNVYSYLMYHHQQQQQSSLMNQNSIINTNTTTSSCYTITMNPGDIIYIPNTYEYSIQSSSTSPAIFLHGILSSSLFSESTTIDEYAVYFDTLIQNCYTQLKQTTILSYTESTQYIGTSYNSLSANNVFYGRPTESLCRTLEKSKEMYHQIENNSY